MEKVFVCLASYYKGYDFLVACKELGNKVILITSQSLEHEDWPWDSIDEVYYMPESEPSIWNLEHLTQGFAYLMRKHEVDAVVAIDDYDVEKAAMLRETFRIPGMGQTTYRYFRDKLAMRQKAKNDGISVPEFCPVFNDDRIRQFMNEVPGPWVLKPRSEASAMGIKKINSEEEIWPILEQLGEERIYFLLESFKPGHVYHVDSLIYDGKILFSAFSKYLTPPMEVSHEGGVFRTITLGKHTNDALELKKINKEVLMNFGLVRGVSHSEFIKGEDGQFYFLETSSRVGGANIHDMIEAAYGINIWKEWAKLETALLHNQKYEVNIKRKEYAGLLFSLTKEENPDTQPFECDEVYKFLNKSYHIGIVYRSEKTKVILERLEEATNYVLHDLLGVLPVKNKPTD